ncbi:MAG TPA: choice-of-anchor tandem repeat GloVer-containing protein [Terriglobales bacterium]|nr:choice-of-anchor tandem repeat GloVer-containing protein [Terriglobales bacterium]
MKNAMPQSRSYLGSVSTVLVLAALLLSAVAVAQSTPAPKLTTLYSFTGGADGGIPRGGPLVQDGAGNLYGTAFIGGSGKSGVVYKVDKKGNETVVYAFTGANGDGALPASGVFRDKEGNLYGTTTAGGNDSHLGIVFKVGPAGKEKVLYSFSPSGGGLSYTGVVQDAAGNLYGATSGGGSANVGTVFKLNKTGKETVLHNFTGTGGDGSSPEDYGSLVLDAKGNLYGTTAVGGDLNCFAPIGCGTVFKLNKAGKETVLYAFTGNDGLPTAGLVQDAAGNLYGTTGGDCNTYFGTVFKLDTKGKEKILHTFSGGDDGACPYPSLVLDVAGNIYGVTTYGGASGHGTSGYGVVFKVNSKGKFQVLHSFGGSDGAYPYTGLILNKAGALEGTTANGGSSGAGTVFKLTP